MDKREQLLEKVEQNYKTFLEELVDYDVDNIVTNSVYIYLMTETHYCIKEGYILNKEEDIDYFLKLEKPLDAICDWYEPNGTEFCESISTVIEEIRDKELYLEDGIEEDAGMTMQ